MHKREQRQGGGGPVSYMLLLVNPGACGLTAVFLCNDTRICYKRHTKKISRAEEMAQLAKYLPCNH